MADTKSTFTEISLDMDLDDIADLPAFISFPTGAYIVSLDEGMKSKKIGEHASVEVAMTLKSIEEMDPENLDPGEEAPKTGDIATQAFLLDNEYGAGNLKKFATPIRKFLEVSTIRETMAGSKGLELLIVTKRRKGKNENKDKNYMDIVKVEVI